LITGEYPDQPGGVSDYTRLIARGLANRGEAVNVWAPPARRSSPADAGVAVHRLPGRFDLASLRRLGGRLNGWEPPGRVLLQYVPHAYGWKAMNVGLARWVGQRRQPVWVMFHEVAFPGESWRPWKHRLLSRVTRANSRRIALGAERVFVSVPAWADLLREITGRPLAIEWLPVPSNLPTEVSTANVRAFRQALALPADTVLVGHFGTYPESIAPLLTPVIERVSRESPRASFLLIGRKSDQFARLFPALASRMRATGALPEQATSEAIAACDLMVQPFPDGVSCRRGSAMACLGLGMPMATTVGALSESFWPSSSAIAAAPAEALDRLAEIVVALSSDPERRAAMGQQARRLYQEKFSLERTLNILLNQESAARV
jgi:glycosyltransferase involved in cell wall biosynthesis